jgi:23S rRNA pseudouridine2605 synthase
VERLQKILSHAGIASRRVSEGLITQGRVEVNGHVVTELGTKADPTRDDIRVDGRRIGKQSPVRRYLLMYKPRGVMSTRDDPQRRTTVIDLLARAGIKGYFYPVGRLDYDSEGLILLTNDGDFAEKVMHPRYELERVYLARVLGVPDERDLARLSGGIVIEGRKTQPAKVTVRGTKTSGAEVQTTLELVLREGRNRQVRKMCEAMGHPVITLSRTKIGSISGKGLRPGDIRELSPGEIRSLMQGTPGAGPATGRETGREQAARPSRKTSARRPRPRG